MGFSTRSIAPRTRGHPPPDVGVLGRVGQPLSPVSRLIEEVVRKEKGLYPNVDFYSASAYHVMGIETLLFTPVFAVSRVAGWTAHVLEQLADNKLIRPESDYVGPRDVRYVPIAERSPIEQVRAGTLKRS
jgi:citrate synthase